MELVVAAQKSVALLGLIGRAEDMQAILDAETDATLAYLDTWMAVRGGRRGRSQTRGPTHGLIWARTRHMADDRGGWKAVDTAALRDILHAAGILETNFPAVYGKGVLGHDHLIGVASSVGDFNVLWEPVLVVFTSVATASTHITTLDQIKAVEASGGAFEIPLPSATFHCSMVSAATYQRGTPSPTVVGP
jgi:hypothetical protein